MIPSDPQLLHRYVTDNSEPAFAELVNRHFSFVYGAAMRQVAGDAELARDITQSVFTDLARKARSLAERPSLVGWLYTSTQFAAAKAVRTEQRRRVREQHAMAMQIDQPEPEVNWERIRSVIDQALHELEPDDRDAVLLRYFQQRGFRDVGEVFGVNEDVARKRVERALDKLRVILSRFGLNSTTSSLAAALESQTPLFIPATLVASITGGALAASAQPALTNLVLQFMTTKQTLAVLGLIAVASTVTSISGYRTTRQLRAEKEEAQRQALAVTAMPDRPAVDLAELERLRNEHDELIRLRGEVARLRREAAEVAARPATPAPPPLRPPPAAPPPASDGPVQIYIANAEAAVEIGQGLVFGGWTTTPGKRMLVFLQPSIAELAQPGRVGSVLLVGQFCEVPDEVVTALGLDLIKTESKATSGHSVLDAEQYKTIQKALRDTPGVDILSAPRVQTGSGMQAVMSVTEQRMIAGEDYTIGPSLDVEPRIAQGGASVRLVVSARYRKVNDTAAP
jgi:RNA polymerase sigma factor (sigma-70 family)